MQPEYCGSVAAELTPNSLNDRRRRIADEVVHQGIPSRLEHPIDIIEPADGIFPVMEGSGTNDDIKKAIRKGQSPGGPLLYFNTIGKP